MDIRKLEAFCRVFEAKSFSRAGQEMFLSQPTISSHIAYLERELGVVLFDRVSRIAMPTQAGELLYKKACELFQIQNETRAAIDELKNKVSGDLVLGGSTIPANYFFPQVLAGFFRKYSGVSVDLRVADSNTICEQVLSGALDMAMVGGYAENPDLDFTSVMRDKLVFIASPDINIPEGKKPDLNHSLDLSDLSRLPWVMREKGSGTRLCLEKALSQVGMHIRELTSSVLVQNTEAMIRCVLAGMGIGVTSRLAVDELLDNGRLLSLEVRDFPLVRDFFLIRHRRRSVFPAARALINHIQRQARRYFPEGEVYAK